MELDLEETQETQETKEKSVKSVKSSKTFRVEIIKMEGGAERKFKIFDIKSPEDWVEASEISSEFELKSAQGQLIFPLNGISLEKWEEIEDVNQIPEWKKEGLEPSEEFIAERNQAVLYKNVALIEAATGMELPGGSPQGKVDFLSRRCPGEMDKLINHINNVLTCLVDGRLVDEYMLAVASSPIKRAATYISSFEDWLEASETKTIFRMQRTFDDYIIEIKLKGLNSEDKARVEAETKMPNVPMRPKRLPGGGIDPSQTEPFYEEPNYKRQVKGAMQRRAALYFDHCLPFKIPGDRVEDRYAWISRRLVGDVVKLRLFIEKQLADYGSEFDFFTDSTGQMA